MVAAVFAQLLRPGGKFEAVFEEVVFAIYDPSREGDTYAAFRAVFPQ